MNLKEKILQRMGELEIQPKRSMGQNFLVSDHVVKRIVDKLKQISDIDSLVEIGPGLGALTDRLIDLKKDLTLVEFDDVMARYWTEERSQKLIHQDALVVDWSSLFLQPTALVSNLPYQIGSRLFVDISILENKPQFMILMFQKEVATSLYGERKKGDITLLSMIRESFWDSHFLLEAGSIDFKPRPRVASQIVCFYPKKVEKEFLGKSYLNFLKILLNQKKRKMIKKLSSIYEDKKVFEAFEDLNFSENTRVHEISIDDIKKLFLKLK